MHAKIKRRVAPVGAPVLEAATDGQALPAWLALIYQTRGIASADELDYSLKHLLPYTNLRGIDAAVSLLSKHLEAQSHLMIIGDYDADGATSTAVAVSSLRALGAKQVSFLVPDRFRDGYGLTPQIVDKALQQKPDLIITVDNGIANHAGVKRARDAGVEVLVTDHHLAPEQLPEANAIVNPNQPGDDFASKALAGVGVIFYVLLALRAQLRQTAWFVKQGIVEPNLAACLDLIALGTVADLVPLDRNNRILVEQGLRRIRAGQTRPGVKALLRVGKRRAETLVASDLAFAIGPRLNAAGRLEDMSIGIACLLSETDAEAIALAEQLDSLNAERQHIEADMRQQAFDALDHLNFVESTALPLGLCVYQADWHQGVIGILAARIKEKYHRPVIAFARGDDGLKGSARSIKNVHIRDVLQAIDVKYPGLIIKYGGHAMAAGLSIAEADFSRFQVIFNEVLAMTVVASDLENIVLSDGSLPNERLTLETALQVRYGGPWGQQFPEPLFDGVFELIEQRIVGMKHLKLMLKPLNDQRLIEAIAFNVDLEQWPNHRCAHVRLAYRIDVNEYKGCQRLQLIVEVLEVAPTLMPTEVAVSAAMTEDTIK